jgi:Protein of unknown function (DUF3551)
MKRCSIPRMSVVVLVALLAGPALHAFAQPAAAYYPVCLMEFGLHGSGARSCYYRSYAECRMAGYGYCVDNPWYVGPQPRLARKHRRR